VAALAVLVSLLATTTARGEHPAEERLEAANAAFAERYVPEQLFEAIAQYEAVLPALPQLTVQSQAHVLNRLAQLCYEATTFEVGFHSSEQALLEKGKAYGLRSLRLCPGFAAWEEEDFARAISHVTDPAALLWTGDNWGVLCGLTPLQGMLFIGRVRLLFERCIEIAPDYWGGSAYNALGALLVATPPLLGGDPDAGRAHLLRAIDVGNDFLQHRVIYAEYWGFTYDDLGRVDGVRDAELIRAQLQIVLDGPIGPWPFWNREAKREAEALLDRLEEMMP
jgi:hypothetical protein